jgi:hypothetical protein
MRSAPQSRLLAAISLINVIVSCESLGLFEQTLDLRFQNAQKSSRWKPQKRLWLDEEKRLFPGPNHPGENHQEQPIGLQIDGVFDLSTEDDELVP